MQARGSRRCSRQMNLSRMKSCKKCFRCIISSQFIRNLTFLSNIYVASGRGSPFTYVSFKSPSKCRHVSQRTRHYFDAENNQFLALRDGLKPTCTALSMAKLRKCTAFSPVLQLTTFPAHLRWIADVIKLARNANRIGTIFNQSTWKYGSNHLIGLYSLVDDVHIKYCYCRRWSPVCPRNWTRQ